MSKFVPPHLATTLVVRDRLLRGLEDAQQYRLTLLSAAAGWGKTSLLTMWASRQRHPVIWVSLDETDNHPARFWITLSAAIQCQIPTVGAAALALLRGPEPPPLSSVLAVLLDDLAAATIGTPTTIVFDDYHVIDDPTLHEAMTTLVEQLPQQVRLVLATRVDPDLPLARWRVQAFLAELRTDDLRFTPDEARDLFARALDDDLGDQEVRQLAQRTEGWAAGLHLSALVLRHQTDRSAFVQTFVGSHRFLLDYVHDEILQRQPPHIQRFLLRIAI
ncbi:MAG: LuxR family transcriptional regulator, partial [Roseiflexaceae bacterium]|nr:LuxR family transcriptional regulator [Roseiflexaceae bacterium]